MKILAHIARIFTGVIFIFSGLIKLNDPVGTQIKLEEYFEVFAEDFGFMAGFWHLLVPYALVFSVLLCSLEVLAGIALLVQYNLKRTAWFLLALCVFFAFLTFYSAYFNKVTDCGCFGEMIKLKPWTSFWKDILLLVLILVILWQRSVFGNPKTGWMVGAAAVLCLGLGIYAIRHLPPYEGLAYAVGQHIPTNMKPSEPFRYKYIMTKNGEELEFDQFPTDTTLKFKEMIMLNENAKPKITDYNVFDAAGDFTQESFKGNRLFIIIGDVKKANTDHVQDLKALANSLQGSAVTPAILTSTSEAEFNRFKQQYGITTPHYYADYKVLKTIIRSNPGVWLMSNGTVKGKWHHNDTPTKEEVLDKLQ
jgi:uncharacterized membrane protein YphA (DoxX/SURF4 family)